MLKPDLEYLLYLHVSGCTFFYDKKQEIKKYQESQRQLLEPKHNTQAPSQTINN